MPKRPGVSSAIQRAQEKEEYQDADVVLNQDQDQDEKKKMVDELIAKQDKDAQNCDLPDKNASAAEITEVCFDKAFAFADQLKRAIDKNTLRYAKGDRETLIRSFSREVVKLQKQSSKENLASVYQGVIALQAFAEGNNRFTYYFLLLLARIFNLSMPPSSYLLNRPKESFANLQKSFLDHYPKEKN